MSQRKIIHIDMDCFYAAVEMKDNPKLRGIPLAIGGLERRSVLCTANYEARKFGVRAAIPTAMALKLCPHLTVIPGNFKRYHEVSTQIHEIFSQYTDMIEPLSLDEAFLDVTESPHCYGSATLMAQEIRKKIFEKTGLTASAGVAPNKLLAKIASDWNKPNGQYVITPDKVEEFALSLPVGKLFGVGKVTEEHLKSHGISTCYDARVKGYDYLCEHFGNFGPILFNYSFGIDERPVISSWVRKSLSTEETYQYDLESLDQCSSQLPPIIDELERRLKNHLQSEENPPALDKLVIKVKFNNFKSVTVEKKLEADHILQLEETGQIAVTLRQQFFDLLHVAYSRASLPVRLLGAGFKFKEIEESPQLPLLFEDLDHDLSRNLR